MTTLPTRVLSNLALPSPAGAAIRAFHDYLPAGTAPSASHPEFARRSLKDILPLIPASERPEALIIASPEYLPVPPDLAAFPGPKILLITDWNVCLRFLPDLCPLFDFCFTDWPGCRLLRRAGIANVFHQPLFGHDPAVFRPLGLIRNLDVSFCGNLNAGLHGERNRLLARVARWAGSRPVHLRQTFGREYVEVLNRTRLAFNHSVRGEANMRLFEAMACGAVPMVEESNQEAAILFQEGRHYFRYAPGRLESRLDELLADPERLAAVGEAARAEVARHTKAEQIRALLETAAREAPGRATPPRGAAEESAKALAKLRLLGSTYSLSEAIAEIPALAASLPGFDAETLPGLLLTLMEVSAGPLPAAEAMLDRLLSDGRQPPAAAAFMRMRLDAHRGRWESAVRHSEACLRALDDLPAPPEEAPEARRERLRVLYGRYYPPVHLGKGFNTDINRAYQKDSDLEGADLFPGVHRASLRIPEPVGPAGWDGLARLLRAHCLEFQSRALAALGRPAAGLALAETLPDQAFASIDVRAARARAAAAAGDMPRARNEWTAAFEERPLDTGVWDGLAEALMRESDGRALIAFLEDVLVLARAFLPEEQARQVSARLERERAAHP